VTPQEIKLRNRIERRYPLTDTRIRLGDTDLCFARIADPDRVLDESVAEEDRRLRLPQPTAAQPPRMPYWAQLWDSALALAQIMARGIPARASILDLGCGMGLAGGAAAAMGGRVLMADLETPALLLARLNTLPWRKNVRVRRVNWQTDCLGERFGLILGADILYERQQWDFLDAFWRKHLACNGAILLGEPNRAPADLFSHWAKARGWHVRESAEPVPSTAMPVRINKKRPRFPCGDRWR
jgi:predicted nicotinamide N-methyase